MARRILTSLLFVAVAVVAIWALGRTIGLRFDLVWGLVWSLGLTLVANMVIGIFRRGGDRDQRHRRTHREHGAGP